jgi:hypothetical protein
MDLNKEAEELFGKHFNGLHNDDITSNHIFRYAIDLTNSKYVQAEKIKAQIEVLEELDLSDYDVEYGELREYRNKMRRKIIELEQKLKRLEDEKDNG